MAGNAKAYIKFTQCEYPHIIQKADENRPHKKDGEIRVWMQTVEYFDIFDSVFHYRYDCVTVSVLCGGDCYFASFVRGAVFDFLVGKTVLM